LKALPVTGRGFGEAKAVRGSRRESIRGVFANKVVVDLYLGHIEDANLGHVASDAVTA